MVKHLDEKMKKKYIGLIPTRLNSTRLPQKALMEIEGLPLVIHTYKRAKLSKLLDINFIYLGRKSNRVRTVHNGSIQLKAIF